MVLQHGSNGFADGLVLQHGSNGFADGMVLQHGSNGFATQIKWFCNTDTSKSMCILLFPCLILSAHTDFARCEIMKHNA